jgi:hypothetical protein
MAVSSITALKNIEYSIGSAGVRMVESVPILDTSDPTMNYKTMNKIRWVS